ncbi:MAG: TonB-dependent receptor [Dokdonella sp.]
MSIRNLRRQSLALAILAAIFATGFASARAEDAPTAGEHGSASNNPDPDRATTLSGIQVNAQKRVEFLQDVPLTMATLNQQALKDAAVHDIKDLQMLVPDLSVTSTGAETQTTARIRSVGTVGDNPGLESSVGVVIDGVARPRTGVAFGDLGEIQQIEVLKGPQGTVFGKNTSAGIISVTTRRPSFNEEGYADFGVGNYGALGVDAAYSNGLGDNAAFRVYAVDRERSGFNDVNPGVGPRKDHDDGDQDFRSLRAQLLLQPNSDLDVLVIGDYTHREENCCVGVTTFTGPAAPIVNALAGGNGVIPFADPSHRLAYSNRETSQDVVDKGLSTEINWNTPWFDNATLTSITSLRQWAGIGAVDIDYSGADIWYRGFGPGENDVRFRTFSQELRLAGTSGRFDWMGGLYFDNEHLRRDDAITLGPAYEPYLSIALLNNIAAAFPHGVVDTTGAAAFLSQATGLPFGSGLSGVGTNDRWAQDAKSAAAFSNVTFHATDALALTAGVRFTHEKKDVDSFYSSPNGGAACHAALANPALVGAALAARGVPVAYLSNIVPTVIGYMCLPWSNSLFNGRNTQEGLSEDEWSGSFKAAYRWDDTVMTYASAARGYKAGGFNLDRVQSANGLSDGATGITPVTDTSFPGEFVNSYELGTKTSWQDGNLLLNAALFHAQYSDFQLNSFLGTSYVVRSVPKLTTQGVDADLLWQTRITGLTVSGGVTYTDAKYGDDLLPDAALALLPGSRASFAPKWTATAGFAYQWNFGADLTARFNVGAKYTSDYNTGSDLSPFKQQDAFTLLNAGFTVGALSKRWNLEFWGRNLTNRTYSQVGFDAPLQTGSFNAFLGAPRTYGVTLHVQL